MHAILLSTSLYLGALFFPNYLYLCIFIWIVPLMTKPSYRYQEGFMWGVLFFSTHCLWIAHMIALKGFGSMRMILYGAVVAYFSIYSAFWFWFQEQLYRYMNSFNSLKGKWAVLCCTWVISTVTFMCLISYCSLAIFDCFEGYPFINPLLPLVSWRWYLVGLPYVGCIGYWIIIVLINCFLFILYKEFDSKALIVIAVLFLFPGVFFDGSLKKNINPDDFFYIKPTWHNQNLSASQTFYEIGRCLDQGAIKDPNIAFVVMPESSFGYNLMDWEDKIAAWTALFSDKTKIFIGAHRHENENVFNSLYMITNGSIVNYYDKKHLMPFVERIPWLCKKFKILCHLFSQEDLMLSYSKNNDQKDCLMEGFRPYICSELFCHAKKRISGGPILFICNDSWLGLDYAQDLALRYVMLQSFVYKVPIIYVGYTSMVII